MIVRERVTGNIHQAWIVNPGPLPEFMSLGINEGSIIVSGPNDYNKSKPMPFLDSKDSTRVGIKHWKPSGELTWEFANSGDILIYKTHQYSDHADILITNEQTFNERYSILRKTI